MIAYLEGQILRSEANLIVLKTSDGVGYAVHVSQHLAVKASPEEFITLHIYTNVREDDISLYGFQKLEEKELFEMLIKTSGVGPKLGLAVLSVLSPSQLVDAVHQSSTESFSQVPGIGEKTAIQLLEKFGNPIRVLSSSTAELAKIKGLGKVRAVKIKKILQNQSKYLKKSNQKTLHDS